MAAHAHSGGDGDWERRILVTGGAGFIGSHVALRLVRKYPRYRVVVLDALDYCASLRNLESIAGARRRGPPFPPMC